MCEKTRKKMRNTEINCGFLEFLALCVKFYVLLIS